MSKAFNSHNTSVEKNHFLVPEPSFFMIFQNGQNMAVAFHSHLQVKISQNLTSYVKKSI